MTEVWDFPASWHNSVQMSYEFKTDILVSGNGTEQRRALRETPRRKVEQTCIVRGAALQRFNRLVGKSQQAVIRMYDGTHYASVATDVAPGGSVVSVESLPSWLTPGDTIALACGRDIEFHQVDSIAGLNLTLHESVSRAWPAGAEVRPTYLGYLSNDIQTIKQTDDLAAISLAFDVLPDTETAPNYPDLPGFGSGFGDAQPVGLLLVITHTDAPTEAIGRPLFLLKPNWTQAPAWKDSREVQDIDFGWGRISRATPIPYQTRMMSWTYLARSTVEADFLVTFFCGMAGQQGEFYAPTWSADMDLAAVATSGDNTLTLVGTDVADLWQDDTVHQAAILFLTGDRRLPRLITNVSIVSGNSVMTVSGVWPYDIDPNEVVMICWLPLCRFAVDALTVEWLTNGKAQAAIAIQTLEHKDAET